MEAEFFHMDRQTDRCDVANRCFLQFGEHA
jgi:hypothetical protein